MGDAIREVWSCFCPISQTSQNRGFPHCPSLETSHVVLTSPPLHTLRGFFQSVHRERTFSASCVWFAIFRLTSSPLALFSFNRQPCASPADRFDFLHCVVVSVESLKFCEEEKVAAASLMTEMPMLSMGFVCGRHDATGERRLI